MHLTCRENFRVTKEFLKESFSKHFRCLTRNYRTLCGKFAISLAKLHFTCPETVSRKNVFCWKNWIIEQFFWDTERNFLDLSRGFFASLSNFHSAYRGNFFSEQFFFGKLVQQIFSFLVIKIWQAHEHLKILVSNGRFGRN